MNDTDHIRSAIPAPGETETGTQAGAPMISFVEIFQILNARRWIVLGIFAVIMTLTVLALMQMTPRYTASATVMIDTSEARIVDVESVLPQMAADQTTLENQVQILRSRGLARRVIDELNLDQRQWFYAPQGQTSVLSSLNPLSWFGGGDNTPQAPSTDSLIDRLLGGQRISIEGLSTVIRIEYTSIYPDKAALLANTIAENYVNDQLEAKFEANERATTWLAEQIEKLGDEVNHAERMVEQYKIENNLTTTEKGGTLLNQQLANLNAQLSLARADHAEAEAKVSQARDLYRAGGDIDSVTQVVASGLIQQLRNQETQLLRREAELSNRYGARHPRMVQIRAEKQNLADKIDREVQRIIQQLSNEADVMAARMGAIESRLNTLESQAAEQRKAEIKLRDLERAANTKRQQHESLLKRFTETRGQDSIQQSDARLLSEARVPGGPSYPRTSMIIGVMSVVSLAFGVMAAFVVEGLDNGFRRSEQVQHALGTPVLSTVREIEAKALAGGVRLVDYVIDKPLSSFAEALRGFETSLMLSDVDSKPKVILVTSALPSEGKTSFAASYARLSAQKGMKTLLIDGDLRHPSVLEAFGKSHAEIGIVDYLAHQKEIGEVIVDDTLTALRILPVGQKAVNPSDLLASDRMRSLMESLRSEYDLIVIDSAPLLPVHDTKHLARLSDKVVFIVRWDHTPRRAAVAALQGLRDLDMPVAGAVLTRADTRRHAYYTYGSYQYYHYNKYYEG